MFRHRVAAAAAVAAGFGVAAKRALPRSNSSTTPLVARNQEEGAASSTQQAVVQCEAADSAAIAAAVGVGVGVAASMAAYLLYQRQPTAGGGWWSAFNVCIPYEMIYVFGVLFLPVLFFCGGYKYTYPRTLLIPATY